MFYFHYVFFCLFPFSSLLSFFVYLFFHFHLYIFFLSSSVTFFSSLLLNFFVFVSSFRPFFAAYLFIFVLSVLVVILSAGNIHFPQFLHSDTNNDPNISISL